MFLGMAGTFTMRSTVRVFLMPCSSMVTVADWARTMQNAPVLRSKGLWYASLASSCAS